MTDRAAFEELFKSVRESCSPTIWSKGVELARRDTVTGDRSSDEEVVLRVLNREAGVSVTVTLWPQDGDWSCQCQGPDDPCAHVAAAVIAMKRAHEQGLLLPQSKTAGGRLSYRFFRQGQSLCFERMIVLDGQESPLTVPLKALAEGRSDLPVSPTPLDYGIEEALGSDRRGNLRKETWPRLCLKMATLEDVTLDGHPVRVSSQDLGMRIRIVDEAPLVRLVSEWDPSISERFVNGIVLTRDGSLHPLAEPRELSPTEYSIIKSGRTVGPQLFGELVGEIIPALRKKIPVVIESRLLPQEVDSAPRLDLEAQPKGDMLAITLSILYGDPPVARVVGGALQPFGRQVPLRDPAMELKLQDLGLREFGLELGQTRYYRGLEAVQMVERLQRKRHLLHVTGEGFVAFARKPPLQPSFDTSSTGDWELHFRNSENAGELFEVEPAAVLAAWERNEPLVALRSGGYAPIPHDWLQKHGHTLRSFLLARQSLPPESPLQKMAKVNFLKEMSFTPSAELQRYAALWDHFEALPTAPLPDDLKADLRSYQREGINWLQFLRSLGLGALLADDMGLGKTLQTMAVFGPGTLVIAPTSVLANWEREIQRFRPNLKVHRYYGPERFLNPHAQVTLTTYAVLRLDAERLAAQPWDTIVLDEAQSIKNPQSQTAQAAFSLSGRFRIALTGTPVENRLEDLWSLFAFLNPGYLGTLKEFRDFYAKPITSGDSLCATQLHQRIKPLILRRLKREVARDLPPKTEAILYAEMTTADKQRYEAMELATKREVIEQLDRGATVMEALEALLRLRQAACHTGLLPGLDEKPASSGKIELLLDKLEETVAEGHKALVFSQWTSFLDLMESPLKERQLGFLRLDGQTHDRDSVVQAFQTEDGPPILLMSLKAGGVGLNLTAADHVFIMDPWWNPAAEEQAADRAYRIGQTNPVFVHPIISLGTIEERIMLLKEKKRQLAGVLTGEEGARGLTKDDLLELLTPTTDSLR